MTNRYRKGADLRDVDRALLHSACFEQGIVPIEDPALDIRRALRTLPPEEARVMKRKFRKLWRRYLAEANKKNPKSKATQTRALGMSKHTPSRQERLERKKLVFEMIWREVVEPALKRFESCQQAKSPVDT